MNVCMVATYDPDPAPAARFRLPFDLECGELIEEALAALARH